MLIPKVKGVTTVALLLLVGIGAVLARGGPASAHEADRDCDEFASQGAAQTFFVEHGGSASNNFDDLDADHDGIACESNPCPCSTSSGPPSETPGSGPDVPTGNRLPVTVVRDVDGDTVYVRYAGGAEGYVRLLGVDTPEDAKPGHPVECGARQAAASMRRMAEGKRATLLTDPTQNRFDRYGRLLAYLNVGARNLDKAQIRDGWGDVYVYKHHPFERVRGFRRAETVARRKRVGAWGRCHGDFHSAESGKQN